MNWSDSIIQFTKELKTNYPGTPPGIHALNPYSNEKSFELTKAFYNKFYNDSNPRIFLIGINPGRFGGGITGIPFTDPINLEERCGIPNDLEKRHELSSRFIYYMIEKFGGVEKFYKRFFISAVSPLGFTRDKKNLNYYDDPQLLESWSTKITEWMNRQVSFGADRSIAFSLGQGKNIKYLEELNEKNGFFEKVEALPHPRWIMQYRLKRLDEFADLYVERLNKVDGI